MNDKCEDCRGSGRMIGPDPDTGVRVNRPCDQCGGTGRAS